MEAAHPLRAWRKANSKTLADVGSRVSVRPSYLSDIERNKKQPSLTLAAKLSQMTELPIEAFVRVSE